MTKAGAANCLALIKAVHSDFDATPKAVEAWALVLADVPDAIGVEATRQALRGSPFAPKPHDLLRLAGGGSPAARAEEAWEDVLATSAAVGAYRSPTFGDPLTSHVVRQMGGWADLCGSDQQAHWLRKEFIEIYQRLAEARGSREVVALPTAGIFERGQLPERGGDLERVVPAIEQGDEQAQEIAAENAWQNR